MRRAGVQELRQGADEKQATGDSRVLAAQPGLNDPDVRPTRSVIEEKRRAARARLRFGKRRRDSRLL